MLGVANVQQLKNTLEAEIICFGFFLILAQSFKDNIAVSCSIFEPHGLNTIQH